MSIWTDLAGKLEAGSKVAAAKAKDLSQLAQLKAQVVSCDNLLLKNYKDLGKAYFEAHKDDEAFEYAEYMDILKETIAKKDDLNAQIALLKASTAEAAEATEEAASDAEDVVETAIEAEEVAEEVVEEAAPEALDPLEEALKEAVEAAKE